MGQIPTNTPIHNGEAIYTIKLSTIIWLLIGCYILFLTFSAIYNVTCHPLAGFPGPGLWQASRLPAIFYLLRARLPLKVHELHIIYGPVVRIAPNELAYSSSQAWKDIYGYQNGKEEIPKFARFYNALTDVPNIVTEPTRFHQVIRRIISPGFSDKCLREQEPILKGYIELLTNQLESNCCDAKGRRLPVDINTWFNSLAFDIAGDLTFGKSFGSLLKGFEDPWVANINSFTGIGLAVILTAAHLGGITLVRILTKLVQSGQQKHITAMTQTLNERIESKTARSDWINELIIAKDGEESGASETSASFLSGLVALLLQNPSCLNRLKDEIRTAFTCNNEITISSVARLSYLQACIQEGHRVRPVAPAGMPRQLPIGGGTIDGKHIPGKTIVAVWQYSANHSPRNFARPDEFRPERWLKEHDPQYNYDKPDAMQPFSFGPRNCLGRNLSYAEIRLVISHLLLNFEITEVDDNQNWLDHPVYLVWERPPLKVFLTPMNPRVRGGT